MTVVSTMSQVLLKKMDTGNTRMNLVLAPQWTLEEYHRECAGLMNVKRLGVIDDNGKNLVGYYRSRFECDTTLVAWNRPMRGAELVERRKCF